jgi:hypothetical protein
MAMNLAGLVEKFERNRYLKNSFAGTVVTQAQLNGFKLLAIQCRM